ncbi:hypothetical protein JXM67_03760, partial [candidate division WOR-3 bacterium]|nr:hypothetical protein [candidate division WOR-3 bacterium]
LRAQVAVSEDDIVVSKGLRAQVAVSEDDTHFVRIQISKCKMQIESSCVGQAHLPDETKEDEGVDWASIRLRSF